jgi:hypothetical protein
MKLRAPKGCGSISYKGRLLVVADDGSLDVEEDVAEDLSAHGFTPFDKEGGAGKPSREDMIAKIMDLTRRSLEASGIEEIRARLKALEGGDIGGAEKRRGSEKAAEPGKLHDDVIESLNRSALFAFLRKKRVRVTLPVTNVELRAAARRALAK